VSGPVASALLARDEVIDRFRYHPATATTGPLHGEARQAFIDLVEWILSDVPAGRHRSLALTALQDACMWTNAAIAIDTAEVPTP
jgi:hypothetical protein